MDTPDASETLLELLTLEQLDTNLYRARNPAWRSPLSLYGGQVAAQALRAAADTVDADRAPHSLHGYFLRAGSPERPTILSVDRDRDGGSYSSRHVNALQDGEVIFSMLASFHRDEEGIDRHVHALPDDAGDPDGLPTSERTRHNPLLDLRHPVHDPANPGDTSRLWVRPHETLPPDPVVQACVLAYVSDLGWAFAAPRVPEPVGGPSLDHAVWFQRPVDAGDWLLIDLTPVSMAGARGVFTGTIHDRAGTLAAWITQEAVLRPARA